MDVLLEGTNKHQIESYLRSPGHALVICAQKGFGKSQVLDYISASLLGLEVSKLSPSASYMRVEPEKVIGINDIRQIKEFLKLKKAYRKKRVISISNCDLMSVEAQNAFLKMLEEPPVDTFFVMSTQSALSLLPTFRSRIQVLNLLPQDKEKLHVYFKNRGYSSTEIERAYSMTGGLPGGMKKLFDNDEENTSFEQAKTILSGSIFLRLSMIESLSKDKAAVSDVLEALQRTLEVALHQKGITLERAKKLHKALKSVIECKNLINNSNPNTKLLLCNLMLSL